MVETLTHGLGAQVELTYKQMVVIAERHGRMALDDDGRAGAWGEIDFQRINPKEHIAGLSALTAYVGHNFLLPIPDVDTTSLTGLNTWARAVKSDLKCYGEIEGPDEHLEFRLQNPYDGTHCLTNDLLACDNHARKLVCPTFFVELQTGHAKYDAELSVDGTTIRKFPRDIPIVARLVVTLAPHEYALRHAQESQTDETPLDYAKERMFVRGLVVPEWGWQTPFKNGAFLNGYIARQARFLVEQATKQRPWGTPNWKEAQIMAEVQANHMQANNSGFDYVGAQALATNLRQLSKYMNVVYSQPKYGRRDLSVVRGVMRSIDAHVGFIESRVKERNAR